MGWLLLLLIALPAISGLPDEDEGAVSATESWRWNGSSETPEPAPRRRLEITGMSFEPAIDSSPATIPGGWSGSVLYAGVNYTRWTLSSDDWVDPIGRVMLVLHTISHTGALVAYCTLSVYTPPDRLPPLDGSEVIPVFQDAAFWTGGMTFTQGGFFRFCWSAGGTFGYGDGAIIPTETSTYHVYGAYDSCNHGALCFASRHFFCRMVHASNAHYPQFGTECKIFMQASTSPLIYSRLTWMTDPKCGVEVGTGLADWEDAWSKEVDPLDSILLGHTRDDLTAGFRHRLCFCPAYDAGAGDGVCFQPNDFVQQVGYLDGLVVSFHALSGEAVAQVLPMTRFSIRVDCGGPWCNTDGRARIKVIERAWEDNFTMADLEHWNASTECLGAVEAEAWYSPANCLDEASGTKVAGPCVQPGSSDATVQVFGEGEVRFLPKIESGIPVAQLFDICFVHDPLEAADGYDPGSDDALQQLSRTFWKVGQLVVEPFQVQSPLSFVVNKPLELRVAPPDPNRTSVAHMEANGTDTWGPEGVNNTDLLGPMLKILEETDTPVDDYQCGVRWMDEAWLVEGLDCNSSSLCSPRAVKINETLVLSGGLDNHSITVRRPGHFAICYCEAWPSAPSEVDPCEDPSHWVMVGKIPVAGPLDNAGWVLSKDVFQQFDITGYGLSDLNTIRFIKADKDCDITGWARLETTFQVSTGYQAFVTMGSLTNDTHVADIHGAVWRHSSVYPHSYITSIESLGNGYSLVKFSEAALLEVGDMLHIAANVEPQSSNWVRQRDLAFIFKGGDTGYRVLEVLDVGRSVKIALSLDPFPEIRITPEGSGRWYRSNKWRTPRLRGTKTGTFKVCWGASSGNYYGPAGLVTILDAGELDRLTVSLTSTAAGERTPVVVTFETGTSSLYRASSSTMRLRLTFQDTTILDPSVDSSVYASPLGSMYEADQLIEASQAVCGQLFKEMYSSHTLGFPVADGCYIVQDPYNTGGRVKSIFIVFRPRNGLQARTEYKLVLNAQLGNATEVYPGTTGDVKDKVLELAVLDDTQVNPSRIIDIGWANPDKLIQEAAEPGSSDPQFHHEGAVLVRSSVSEDGFEAEDYGGGNLSGAPVELNGTESAGLSFLLRGDEVGKIVGGSILRLYMWPLTAWNFNFVTACSAFCTVDHVGENHSAFAGSEGQPCAADATSCSYEAAESECFDWVPDGSSVWKDIREQTCEHYSFGWNCAFDAERYVPLNGVSALEACCACYGGIRGNYQTIKLDLPSGMLPLGGSDLVDNIRFFKATPLPELAFFPSRFGVQLTNSEDLKPDYTVSVGRYLSRPPSSGSIGSTATLVSVNGWGNSNPYKASPNPNDFFLRLQMPLTVYRAPDAASEVETHISVSLPEGHDCLRVEPAVTIGEGDTTEELPVLPASPPTGSGALPASSSWAGGNGSAPATGLPSGTWEMAGKDCIFHLAPHMAIFAGQRLYLHIWAMNPLEYLAMDDPLNFWVVNMTSAGAWGTNATYEEPCPASACNATANPSEAYLQSYEPIYPPASELESTVGRIDLHVPSGMEDQFVTNFFVLGKITGLMIQPTTFRPDLVNELRIWFQPDLGAVRPGLLGIQAPEGFDFGYPCLVSELPATYYAHFASPAAGARQRVWPLDGVSTCTPSPAPGWSPGGSCVTIEMDNALIAGRQYGFILRVTNPPATSSDWLFKVHISDVAGFGRDGTEVTAPYHVGGAEPWPLYAGGSAAPALVQVADARPYVVTGFSTVLEVNPMMLEAAVVGPLRIIAPAGYEWSFTEGDAGTFVFAGIDGQTMPMPGGIPALSTSDPSAILWAEDDSYLAGETYAFRTFIKVPPAPPSASADDFFFEWGYGDSSSGAAARAAAPAVRALRHAWVESSNELVGQEATLLIWVETITEVPNDGALEVGLPYSDIQPMLEGDGPFCKAAAFQELGSLPVSGGVRCRHIIYYQSGRRLSAGGAGAVAEARLELSANSSGVVLAPGIYIFEVNITNPLGLITNPADSSRPCGYLHCFSFHSNSRRVEAIASGQFWVAQEAPISGWQETLDYESSAPAPPVTQDMVLAEMVNLTLEERVYTGRYDTPGMRSAIIFAFMMNSYTPVAGDVMEIRAPIGWVFDSECDFWTASGEIYPEPLAGVPVTYVSTDGTLEAPTTTWPAAVAAASCLGLDNSVRISIGEGLLPLRLYMFRLGVRENPIETPLRNTWSLRVGGESSGPIPGFALWTFPEAKVEPIMYAWTTKENPSASSVMVQFMITNTLQTMTFGETVEPMLRVVMPPQFEFVIDDENQDLQGGSCSPTIIQRGSCMLCNEPLSASSFRCERETNRKNVAKIYLQEGETMDSGELYEVWFTIFNPHIVDAVDADPRTWSIESFFGDPVPYAFSYPLDAVDVSGYRISGRAVFTLTEVESRDASDIIEPQVFTMYFPDPLEAGDTIELRAPPSFDFWAQVPGQVQSGCYGFEWLPATLNVTAPNRTESIPARSPAWSSSSALILEMPLGNTSKNATELLLTGFPAWAVTPEVQESLFEAKFLVQQMRCLGCTASLTVGPNSSFDWHALPPLEFELVLLVVTEPAMRTPEVVNLTEVWLELHPDMSNSSRSDNFNSTNGTNATVQPLWLCLRATTTVGQGNSSSEAENSTLLEELCELLPADVPFNSSVLAFRLLDPEANTTSCSCAEEDDGTGGATPLPLEVIWETTWNLTEEVEAREAAYQEAMVLPTFDLYPLQHFPTCEGNVVTFYPQAHELHPEAELLNGTTYAFKLGYKNPMDPSHKHLNYWVLSHNRSSELLASAAVPGWEVASKLRWVKIGLLAEMLRPTDQAEIHVEFVTMGPADGMRLWGVSPEGYDFTGTYITSVGTGSFVEPSLAGRRLLWQGFTSAVAITSAEVSRVTFSVTFSSREYVRFRIAGMLVPYAGGQSLYTIETTLNGLVQDNIVDCCEDGYPADNPAEVMFLPYRLQNVEGELKNYYALNVEDYPVAPLLGTRLNMRHTVILSFQMDVPYKRPTELRRLVLVVRTPAGYLLAADGQIAVWEEEVEGDFLFVPERPQIVNQLASATQLLAPERLEVVLLDQEEMREGFIYRVQFDARTPVTTTAEVDPMWAIEVTDQQAMDDAVSSANLGALQDFTLLDSVDLEITTEIAAPGVQMEIEAKITGLGLRTAYRVDIIAPVGYSFLDPCFDSVVDLAQFGAGLSGELFIASYLATLQAAANGSNASLANAVFTTCKKSSVLLGGEYYDVAQLQTLFGITGNTSANLATPPVTVVLKVTTPDSTPAFNRWWGRTWGPSGVEEIGWGMHDGGLDTTGMQVMVNYPAIAHARVTLFLSFEMRYAMPWDGHIILAAPMTYQLHCPVKTVLSPRDGTMPLCHSPVPGSTSCEGLPTVGEASTTPGLPACDPRHELLLSFTQAMFTGELEGKTSALDMGAVVFLTLDATIPAATPSPHSANVFRLQALDKAGIPFDGKQNTVGAEVASRLDVIDFKLWFQTAAPSIVINVAIDFTLNQTYTRALEDPLERLRVIEIVLPSGFTLAVEKVADVVLLNPKSQRPLITEWNWTATLPNHIWFGLDTSQDISGRFHYWFPIQCPTLAEGIPFNNIWEVKFCVDSPLCSLLVLRVPVVGFWFNEDEPYVLDAEATATLVGSECQRRVAPLGAVASLLVAWLALAPLLSAS